jgi:hypothetical protein
MGHAVRNVGKTEYSGVCWRRKRIARDVSAHMLQPKRHPASLEAGVSRKKYLFTVPKIWINVSHM